MAKINLVCANLHNTFILAGKNFGPTVEKAKITGIEMVYDQLEKELWITYNKKTAIIPMSNVVCMVPEELAPLQVTLSEPELPEPKRKVKAQVSTPTSHVFEGEGAGQTGQK